MVYHIISQLGIALPAATEPTKRVEHSGTHETDEGDHAELKLGRGIPADLELADANRLVHPTGRTRDFTFRVMISRLRANVGRFLDIGLRHGDEVEKKTKKKKWRGGEVVEGKSGEVGERRRGS